jgi:hypothetical protein
LQYSHGDFGPSTVIGECRWNGMKWRHLALPVTNFPFTPWFHTYIFAIILKDRATSHVSEFCFKPWVFWKKYRMNSTTRQGQWADWNLGWASKSSILVWIQPIWKESDMPVLQPLDYFLRTEKIKNLW